MLKKYKIVYACLIIIAIVFLVYFFWPTTYRSSNLDQDIILHKYTDGIAYDYQLNVQEINDLVGILEKSKFYHGVLRPDSMSSDRLIDFRVPGKVSPIISIYYDTNKTYVFANISDKIKLNDYYRISNKDEIRKFIENIVNTKAAEFKQVTAY